MGGVDLFDNAMNNYRISVRGKKWYWPLITNALDAAMVNAWKLHVFCAKYAKEAPKSQFDFRVQVVEALVTVPDVQIPTGKAIVNAQQIAQRTDRVDHVIGEMPTWKRCAQCGGKTRFGCPKCDATVHPKCFADYHNAAPRDNKKLKKSQ